MKGKSNVLRPKYTLVFVHWSDSPYQIQEHSILDDGDSYSETVGFHDNFEDALKNLNKLSDGEVVLAHSSQKATKKV